MNDIYKTSATLDERSLELRRVIVNAMNRGGRGHLASALSLVEILRVLYDEVLRYDAKNPSWAGRDRFILSKGHGCLALYAILADKGFFPRETLDTFCRFDSALGGHPEPKAPGVEVSTGSLGHGLPIGVGMAIAAKLSRADHRVFVVCGDGECNEGTVWEAAMAASKHKLDNLVVMVDYNKQQSYGTTFEVMDLEPFTDKWRAFGFEVDECDGHDLADIRRALAGAGSKPGKPTAIICHTIKGRGVPFAENNLKWHHKSGLKEQEMTDLMNALEGN